MAEFESGFISKHFLRSAWAQDYKAFQGSPEDQALTERLSRWAARSDLGETKAEAAFIETFFHATWGYLQDGQQMPGQPFSALPQFAIPGAGTDGGTGLADLALGSFTAKTVAIPQIVCEFKGIHADLDAPQKRRGKHGARSPVQQCLDYLVFARRGMIGTEPVLPLWSLVTDMNRFRLYWYDRGAAQYLDFIIAPHTLLDGPGLLGASDQAQFDRFLFTRLFHRDILTSRLGPPELLALIRQQGFQDRKIENRFYGEYRALRETLYADLLALNGPGTPRFPGTRGRLVRLAQKILDRLLFVFFCEDMGGALAFPPRILQQFLTERANSAYFDPEAKTIWPEFRRLFQAMDEGSAFGQYRMHRFNGGLFAADPALDALELHDGVFCQHLQGQNEESLRSHPRTVLYLAAAYNYAADFGEASPRGERNQLGLYMLGRIFEQSITELEILEAEADGRPSVNRASQRKRDGVYYTPEWVVDRIVELTFEPRFAELRAASGWPTDNAEAANLVMIEAYETRLRRFAVLDPACGSGAFLITALRALMREWRRVLSMRRRFAEPNDPGPDFADIISRILTENIFGIDINPASVEITQLALWLHTARADRPLSSLESSIRCGNSLVAPDFYREMQYALYDEEDRERVNAFDWRTAFPEVAARGGFDVVIGNPPYVKLQNFRVAYADVAEYLKQGRAVAGGQHYASTQTGNFDLYLPFIERGISMLNENGRLGYIAPSLWVMNEYGAGLRTLIARHRNLDRWIDFKSFQVFEEATTYTALQFFTASPSEGVRVLAAPDGVVPPDPFTPPPPPLPWERVAFGERWLLADGAERALIDRLAAGCRRLDHPANTSEIFVGVQTSADAIYHLEKLGPDLYRCHPQGKPRPAPYEVAIEDAIMKPLVSGAEAKRYVTPETNTYLLFPYEMRGERMALITPEDMAARFPKAWAHLLDFEEPLRAREQSRDRQGIFVKPFDDAEWYRFGRNQNIDKQDCQKLLVPRLVLHLGCAVDPDGVFYLDNVDVGGITVAEGQDPWYLAGILNSSIADFVFQRLSKPFRGDYLSANKQFIAPLPIPDADIETRAAIAAAARNLQTLHSERRDLLARIRRRLDAVPRKPRADSWLFPGLARDKPDLEPRIALIGARLYPGAVLSADLSDGELRFLVDGVPVLEKIFVDAAEASFLLAQWRYIAATFDTARANAARSLCKTLRHLAVADNPALAGQVIEAVTRLSECNVAIASADFQSEAKIADLYRLTYEERGLVAESKNKTKLSC